MMYLMFMLVGIGRSTGSSPQSQTATLQFILAPRVGIYVGNDVTWDFTTMPNYPPSSFPQAYSPTSPSSSPYMDIEYFINTNVNWALNIRGSGNPSPNLTLDEIQYSEAGSGSWTSLTTSNVPLRTGNIKTTGWEPYNLDWRVIMSGDEEPGTYTTTVIITMQTI